MSCSVASVLIGTVGLLHDQLDDGRLWHEVDIESARPDVRYRA